MNSISLLLNLRKQLKWTSSFLWYGIFTVSSRNVICAVQGHFKDYWSNWMSERGPLRDLIWGSISSPKSISSRDSLNMDLVITCSCLSTINIKNSMTNGLAFSVSLQHSVDGLVFCSQATTQSRQEAGKIWFNDEYIYFLLPSLFSCLLSSYSGWMERDKETVCRLSQYNSLWCVFFCFDPVLWILVAGTFCCLARRSKEESV